MSRSKDLEYASGYVFICGFSPLLGGVRFEPPSLLTPTYWGAFVTLSALERLRRGKERLFEATLLEAVNGFEYVCTQLIVQVFT